MAVLTPANAWEWLRRRCGYAMPRLGPPLNLLYRKTRPRTAVRTELLPGITADLDLADDTANNIYYLGTRYEFPTLPILCAWATRPDVTHFLDVGSNFGYFALAVARRAPRLSVVAFEPHPLTHARLRELVTSNGLAIECVQSALSNTRGALRFQCDPQNSGSSHVVAEEATVDSTLTEEILVPAISFDEWVLDRGSPFRAVVKIDAEGHEEAVLEGMEQALASGRIAAVCVEENAEVLARENKQSTTVSARLQRHGFREISAAEMRRRYGRSCTENRFFERA